MRVQLVRPAFTTPLVQDAIMETVVQICKCSLQYSWQCIEHANVSLFNIKLHAPATPEDKSANAKTRG